MKKRLLSLLLVLALILPILAGCVTNNNSNGSHDLAINGVPLSEYTIIYPEGADSVTTYTAFALADYFKANTDVEFKGSTPMPDTTEESDYEILIGATNRAASQKAAQIQLEESQYVFFMENAQVVCHGNGYYVGSAVYEFISTYFPDTKIATESINATGLPTEPVAKNFVFPDATSVIMMIGDGMGYNHIEMALHAGVIDRFYAYDLPYFTWCRTYSLSGVTDSAASATALATGYKTINGYIGQNESGENVPNVSEVAYGAGANVAVLTTDHLHGATPSGFNVHTKRRGNSGDILDQFYEKIRSEELKYAKGQVQLSPDKLTDGTRDALRTISANDSRFFIMIEEAYTDKGSHSNDASVSNAAVARLNDAVAYAIAFVMLHPDTALILTADHETGGLTQNENGGYDYTTDDHTGADVPYFALGGENVAKFIATDEKLDNVWNASFIASIFGNTNFGDPAYRHK